MFFYVFPMCFYGLPMFFLISHRPKPPSGHRRAAAHRRSGSWQSFPGPTRLRCLKMLAVLNYASENGKTHHGKKVLRTKTFKVKSLKSKRASWLFEHGSFFKQVDHLFVFHIGIVKNWYNVDGVLAVSPVETKGFPRLPRRPLRWSTYPKPEALWLLRSNKLVVDFEAFWAQKWFAKILLYRFFRKESGWSHLSHISTATKSPELTDHHAKGSRSIGPTVFPGLFLNVFLW